jgi:hypothetical protein
MIINRLRKGCERLRTGSAKIAKFIKRANVYERLRTDNLINVRYPFTTSLQYIDIQKVIKIYPFTFLQRIIDYPFVSVRYPFISVQK